ncbi:aromatic acid exporter family protein [Terrisporobacter sp.]
MLEIRKPGLRSIKTGLGVMICVLIGRLHIVQNVFYAAITCSICMQITVKGSVVTGFNRLKGTLIGGIVGFFFALIYPGSAILACIGIIVTIYICNSLKLNKSIVIACVVFCAVFLGVGSSNPIRYSLFRMWDTSIGVLVGVAVNYLVFRPNYVKSIYKEIGVIEETSIELLKSEIEKGEHADISVLNNEIKKLEDLYKNFLDDLKYNRDISCNEEINNIIKICKQIFLHIKILERIENKSYLNRENYIKSKNICGELQRDAEINGQSSIVYNYHVGLILNDINEIRQIRGIDSKHMCEKDIHEIEDDMKKLV